MSSQSTPHIALALLFAVAIASPALAGASASGHPKVHDPMAQTKQAEEAQGKSSKPVKHHAHQKVAPNN